MTQLCEVTDCSNPVTSKTSKFELGKAYLKKLSPTIDSVFFAPAPGGGITGEPAVLTPAGTIYVKGTGLHEKSMRLKGNFLGGKKELQLLTFYEADGTKAHAKIPTDLKADGRIEVTIQVGNSNEFQRQFEVPFEIMRLTGGFKWRGYGLTDIVKVVSCGSQPSLDCVIGDLATYLDYGDVKSPFTIRAVHDCPLCVYSNKGVDRYSISLPESWPCVIYDANSGWYGSSEDESVLLSPENSALGQTEWSPEAVWVVSPGDIARYAINVWIKCQI